jgi:hypothetical protein
MLIANGDCHCENWACMTYKLILLCVNLGLLRFLRDIYLNI